MGTPARRDRHSERGQSEKRVGVKRCRDIGSGRGKGEVMKEKKDRQKCKSFIILLLFFANVQLVLVSFA